MGELILCRRPIAATPYYIDELSLNIYSLEELSYYISHNVYLINSDFMTVDLCNFIGRELNMKELSNELLNHIEKNGSLAEFVQMILAASGYLTVSEIKDTISIISAFENKTEAECRKWRADRLLEKERYIEAIYEYELMLETENMKGMNVSLSGDIYHNLGTCYARLFFFDHAAECYRKAYESNHKIVSLKSLLCCYKCNQNQESYDQMVKRYFVTNDSENQIDHIIENYSDADKIKQFDEALDTAKAMGSENFKSFVKENMGLWKDNYNLICRI